SLAKGVGHFTGTSIWDGNTALAGHNRGVNTYFGQIHTLRSGDTIRLTTKLGTRTYSVTSVSKIRDTDTSVLAATAEDCITLVTCVRDQPAYRWCVRAKLV
ncbi:MAG: sortase, partial [Oscillospiraceae bacterium]|nr:sortase [Oscillospiraceae bacterium]